MVPSGRVIVAGSINMDIVMHAQRLPQPGETIIGDAVQYHPGGKGANQAVAAQRQDASALMIGRVGDDEFGHHLREFLLRQSVDVQAVRCTADTATGIATITVAQDTNTIVVASGANSLLAPEDVQGCPMHASDILVSQCETPLATTTAFFVAGKKVGATTVFNPAPAQPLPADLLQHIDILIMNETELALLAQIPLAAWTPEQIAEHVQQIKGHEQQTMIITLGARGCVICEPNGTYLLPAYQVPVVDSTGAGDCFVGTLAASLLHGQSLITAAQTANAAAALCVQHHGASPSIPTAQQTLLWMETHNVVQ